MRSTCVVLASVCFLSQTAIAAGTAAKKIIFDTDINSDVDDVGALAIANTLHRCGKADVLGVAVNTGSKYGSLAASAVNTYFGHGDIPIAALRPITNDTFFDDWAYIYSEYVSKVAYNWPHDLSYANDTAEPSALYRQLLAKAENSSVTIVSVGFLNNLAALLDSPADELSPLNGTELVSAKVAELVLMGGEYPSGWEFNMGSNVTASQRVINGWPRTVAATFLGSTVGSSVSSAANLARQAPADSPVLAAYQWYVGRGETARFSWDPMTLLYGILGLNAGQRHPIYAYGNSFGYNTVDDDGNTAWVNDTSVTNQHWLELAGGVSNATMATLLDRYFSSSPKTPHLSLPDLPPLPNLADLPSPPAGSDSDPERDGTAPDPPPRYNLQRSVRQGRYPPPAPDPPDHVNVTSLAPPQLSIDIEDLSMKPVWLDVRVPNSLGTILDVQWEPTEYLRWTPEQQRIEEEEEGITTEPLLEQVVQYVAVVRMAAHLASFRERLNTLNCYMSEGELDTALRLGLAAATAAKAQAARAQATAARTANSATDAAFVAHIEAAEDAAIEAEASWAAFRAAMAAKEEASNELDEKQDMAEQALVRMDAARKAVEAAAEDVTEDVHVELAAAEAENSEARAA